ncbi:MAG: GTP-binding protein [Vicinamibacterales bacterium]
MRIERVEFVTSAAGAPGFPRDRLPEVALVGRSNVGKSSLINALARRTIARTSAAPGKTRLANFYRVQPAGDRPFYVVDLPGYGYARGVRPLGRLGAVPSGAGGQEAHAALSTAQGAGDPAAEAISRLAEQYFDRPGARGALLLVDARHPGLEADMAAWEWLQAQPFPAAVAASKVDKLTRAERVRHSRQLDSLFAGPVPLVSAHSGEGLEELWKLIVKLPRPPATAA